MDVVGLCGVARFFFYVEVMLRRLGRGVGVLNIVYRLSLYRLFPLYACRITRRVRYPLCTARVFICGFNGYAIYFDRFIS